MFSLHVVPVLCCMQTDISEVVIKQMQQRHAQYSNMTYRVSDCRCMPEFMDCSFGHVLDKGGFCGGWYVLAWGLASFPDLLMASLQTSSSMSTHAGRAAFIKHTSAATGEPASSNGAPCSWLGCLCAASAPCHYCSTSAHCHTTCTLLSKQSC
jgi:hypothetical protein